jgi:hypothetical protein
MCGYQAQSDTGTQLFVHAHFPRMLAVLPYHDRYTIMAVDIPTLHALIAFVHRRAYVNYIYIVSLLCLLILSRLQPCSVIYVALFKV